MIVRIWRTEIDATRADEYRAFASSRSVPMFRKQEGFAGVLFAAASSGRVVITLWHDLDAVEALDHSPTYKSTVAEIQSTGFLRGESTVEVLELEDAFFTPAILHEAIT